MTLITLVTFPHHPQEPLPKGGDPTVTYIRETKELAIPFKYYSPAPVVRSVRWYMPETRNPSL